VRYTRPLARGLSPKDQHRRPVLGFIALAAAVTLLAALQTTRPLDLRLLDVEFKVLRALRGIEPAPEVVLVGIDEGTLAAFPEPIALWHKHFGALLKAFAQARPAAVGLDVVLPDRSYDSVASGYDRELIRGLALARHTYPLVLGITVDTAGTPRRLLPALTAAAGPDATGFLLWRPDADNVVRHFDEHLADRGVQVPTLVGQLARKLGREPGSGIIDYSFGSPFDYLPMHTVVDAYQRGELASIRTQLEGKIVLVGPVLPFEDRRRQPVLLARWEQDRQDAPDLLVHAQAIRSIFGPGLVKPLSPALPVALALLATLLWFAPFTLTRALLLLVLVSMILLGLSLWLTAHHRFLGVSILLCGAWGSVLARLALEATKRSRERKRLRGALAGYVGPQVVEEVVSGRLPAGLEGRRAFVCVMFVDIRNFTSRSEAMNPESVVSLLDRYFEEVVACVHGQDGTVAQLMGDGLMAVFGAPNPLSNPSCAAFSAAQAIFQRVGALNLQLQSEGVAPLRVGVGLNAGQAVVGHVGARARHEYTATGDVVNVAARLERLTKETGYRVVCSPSVAAQLDNRTELVALGEQAMKGHSPMLVYGWGRDSDTKADVRPAEMG
jgi:adenylate cyclase